MARFHANINCTAVVIMVSKFIGRIPLLIVCYTSMHLRETIVNVSVRQGNNVPLYLISILSYLSDRLHFSALVFLANWMHKVLEESSYRVAQWLWWNILKRISPFTLCVIGVKTTLCYTDPLRGVMGVIKTDYIRNVIKNLIDRISHLRCCQITLWW